MRIPLSVDPFTGQEFTIAVDSLATFTHGNECPVCRAVRSIKVVHFLNGNSHPDCTLPPTKGGPDEHDLRR